MKTISLMFLILILNISGLVSTVSDQNVTQTNVLEVPGSSSLIRDWIGVHLKTIRNGKVFNHHHRQSSYIGIALYESIVEGDKNYRTLMGQLDGYEHPKWTGSKDICWQSSANTAFATMLRYFYPHVPADKVRFDSLENAWRQHLITDGYSEASIEAGSQYASMICQSVIEWCQTDGDDKMDAAYDIPKGMGLWEPTPPKFVPPVTPYMGNCRCLVKGSIDNTLPPPPAVFSAENQSDFFKMAEEVYKVSQQMDDEKKGIGLYWDDFPDGKSVTSGGHWASILKTVMEERNTSLIEGAHLYAALFTSTHDASVGCFKAKYTYNLMRPVTYIQKYMNHSDWNPMIVTPPHPEYPAAHAVISMAAATMLTRVMGDDVSFSDQTYLYRGYKPHNFKNFVEAAREAGMSRFYGGIHYLPSIEAGFIMGKTVADNIADKLIFRNN